MARAKKAAAEKFSARIAVQCTPGDRATYLAAALTDKKDLSGWVRDLMDRRIEEQHSGKPLERAPWECPRCQRINAPWREVCDCKVQAAPNSGCAKVVSLPRHRG